MANMIVFMADMAEVDGGHVVEVYDGHGGSSWRTWRKFRG
jgi:hypothetical protein